MEIVIDTEKSEVDIYEELMGKMPFLLLPSDKVISNLGNFIAVIKSSFSKISWIGFYIAEDNFLYLGPFQGTSACSEIAIGEGVCGTSAEKRKTIYVRDVNEFSGHIACDSNSKSEIVVPIITGKNVWGVLDIDSYNYSAFSDNDKSYLEKLVEILIKNVDLNKYILR